MSGVHVLKARHNAVEMKRIMSHNGIMHERQAFDLRADTATGGWVDTLKYTNAGPLLAQEIGQFAGCRVQATTQAPVFGAAGAAGVDVLRAVVFGPGAIAFGDLQTVSAHVVLPGG